MNVSQFLCINLHEYRRLNIKASTENGLIINY